MNVILLSAGNGRLHHDWVGGSRCLLKIGGETVLGRQIRLFKEFKLTDIIVVVSYDKKRIMESHKDVRYVFSDYKDEEGLVNSFPSLLKAKDFLRDSIIFNGDTIFLRETLKEILDEPLIPDLGLMFAGSELKTKFGAVGLWAIKMNGEGAEYIKNLKEPLRTSVRPEGIAFRDAMMMDLFWHINLNWAIKTYSMFTPQNFIIDIDKEIDYKSALEMVGQKENL